MGVWIWVWAICGIWLMHLCIQMLSSTSILKVDSGWANNSPILHCRLVTSLQIRAVAGQRSSPDLCFVTKSINSTTKDIDLIVTQVGCDGTA